MAENTKIEWADHTFNPWIGCTQISPGCDYCYAKSWDQRYAVSGHARRWGAGVTRTHTSASTWAQPIKWNKQAQAAGIRYRVFCASLADVFDNEVPVQWRIELVRLIMSTPHLDWLLLTKRIGNAADMLETAFRGHTAQREGWRDNVPPNVWIGATIVNQDEADRDIPKLLAVPAARRFLSMEPLLGPVDLTSINRNGGTGLMRPLDGRFNRLDWVIVGGESGPNARPMHPDWARDLRDQCQAAGVPFLFKQWGEWTPGENVERQRGVIPIASLWDNSWQISNLDLYHDHGHIDDQPDLYRVGKKAAGRHLDGEVWDGVPS